VGYTVAASGCLAETLDRPINVDILVAPTVGIIGYSICSIATFVTQ